MLPASSDEKKKTESEGFVTNTALQTNNIELHGNILSLLYYSCIIEMSQYICWEHKLIKPFRGLTW